MGYLLRPFDHASFHIPQSISTRITKKLQADHPLILSFLSSGAAICTYQLFAQYSPAGHALAALAGTSATLLIVFAIEGSNGFTVLLNLFTVPLVFALAYASLSGSEFFLVAAFAVQALVIANQIMGAEGTLKTEFYCLAFYNATLALLLL